MGKYELTPIKSVFDALQVREIRNQCRFFMTNDVSELSIVKQLYWYFFLYKKKNKEGTLRCFLLKSSTKSLGFGVIREIHGTYWLTGGLGEKYRGKGIGTVLFQKIIQKAPSPIIWLEVLESNSVARKLYKKLGFKKSSEKYKNRKKIFVMNLRRAT